MQTVQFKTNLKPDTKKKLIFIANYEGRSMTNMIDRLIHEKYNAVKIAQEPEQRQSNAITA